MELAPLCPKYLKEGIRLYEEAFPESERRPTAAWRSLMRSAVSFRPRAILEAGTFAGLITSWHFNDFTYVEHFAICSGLRSRGLGSRAFRLFMDDSPVCPVVLEVEMPETDTARRRIAFYERQGLSLLPFEYMQPAYVPGGTPLPLRLMTNHTPCDDEKFFHRVKTQIWKTVYHYETPRS